MCGSLEGFGFNEIFSATGSGSRIASRMQRDVFANTFTQYPRPARNSRMQGRLCFSISLGDGKKLDQTGTISKALMSSTSTIFQHASCESLFCKEAIPGHHRSSRAMCHAVVDRRLCNRIPKACNGLIHVHVNLGTEKVTQSPSNG